MSRETAIGLERPFVDVPIKGPSDLGEKWILPPPEHPALPHLPVHCDALGCQVPGCNYICCTKNTMSNHYSEVHNKNPIPGIQMPTGRDRWRTDVQAQKFCNGSPYFEVNRSLNQGDVVEPDNSTPAAAERTPPTLQSILHAQIRKNKISAERSMMNAQALASLQTRREINPWLERTRWLKYLKDQDHKRCHELTTLPKLDGTEKLLQIICLAFRNAMYETRDHMKEERINLFDRSLINELKVEREHLKPLTVPHEFNQYVRDWQKLLCYFVRTAPQAVGGGGQLYKITESQREAFRIMRSMAMKVTGMTPVGPAYSLAFKELQELTVRLSIEILDHQLYGDEYESVIVCFLAMNAVSSKPEGGFREISSCTMDLTHLIKIAQFTVIQQSIYFTSSGKNDHLCQGLKPMRDRFLLADGRSPMAWMLKMRQFGLYLTQHQTVDGYVVWSPDNQKITFGKFETTMTDFRMFVSLMMQKGNDLLAQLFLLPDGQDLRDPEVSPTSYRFVLIPRSSPRSGYATRGTMRRRTGWDTAS
jgi:hypothetical protein